MPSTPASRVFSSLTHCLSFLNSNPFLLHLSLVYAQTMFKKTKTFSHLSFLKHCLRLHVIPKGFQITHSPANKSDSKLVSNTDRITRFASRSLMSANIKSLNRRLVSIDMKLVTEKGDLCSLSPPPILPLIKQIVHTHNQLTYHNCKDVKDRKLSRLLGPHSLPPSEPSVHTLTAHGGPSHDTGSHSANPVEVPNFVDYLVQCIPPSLPLTDSERSVLSKGLKFVPQKAHAGKYQTLVDVERFSRTLRWMGVFGHVPRRQIPTDTFNSLFENKVSDNVPPEKLPDLEYFLSKVHREIKGLVSRPLRNSNLSVQEAAALRSLRNRQDIIIKPADKGGAVVVWRRDLYLQEAHRQLDNTTTYTALPQPSLPADSKLISDTVKTAIKSGSLPQTANLLIKRVPRQPTFYLLPKIHKANTPGRPIVSAVNCPTEHLSQYLDTVFQPIVQSLPSFIKDTTDTLRLLDDFNEAPPFHPNLLFTMDVCSLYTSIPHADGLKALTFFLNKRSLQQPPTQVLVRLAELVLTLNTFEFDGQIFQQNSGVAMGTKMGPSFACLFMGFLEHGIQSTYPGPHPELYRRYIDDGIGATSLSEHQLRDYISFVNDFHPSIDYTFDISSSTVAFLDMHISIHNDTFLTSVHYKPTDAHAYLHFQSSHPSSTINGIPFSQLLRLRRLCADPADFEEKAVEMCRFFTNRLYPQADVDLALHKVSQISRLEALQPRGDSEIDERPTLVLTHHPHNLPVRRIILSNWHILQQSSSVGDIFRLPPLLAYRRDTNLRDLLVRSTVARPTQTPPGSFPCPKPLCPTCPHLIPSAFLQGPKCVQKITRSFSCNNFNLVYAITCTVCPKVYIGETGRTLDTRFREHLADVRHNRNSPVAKHFNSVGHSVAAIRVRGLWQMRGTTIDRKLMESHLIRRLGTYTPDGLNLKL